MSFSLKFGLLNAFGGEKAVKHWSVCRELHQDGKPHYHLALKLETRTRFIGIKNSFEIKYPTVKCNFREFHTSYEDAFDYIKKEDEFYVVSEGHPYLLNRPRTAAATARKIADKTVLVSDTDLDTEEDEEPQRQRVRYSGGGKHKLDEIAVYELITRQNVRTEDELLLQARLQYDEGKEDLLRLVMRMPGAKKREMIKTAWGVKDSKKKAERKKMSRMDILREARNTECVCNDRFRLCAVEVLERNEINVQNFKAVVLKALEFGRDKMNNVCLYGLSNCGKTFLLQPLLKIYDTFSSPASGTFAWVGAEKKEVVLLNDFRWSEKVIPWSDFLNLLEGWPIHIPMPKTSNPEDVVWEQKTPIFATMDKMLVKTDGKTIDRENTKMMDNRWNYFEFYRPLRVIQKMEPCGRCFARFMLS